MKKRFNILLVEDNRMEVELTLNAFQEINLNCKVHTVDNGEKALDFILGRGDFGDRNRYPLPDLILLDLKLPGISGHEVVQQVKRTEGVNRIPIIVLTSSMERSDLITCYEYGANSYLVKPVSFESFLEVIRKINDYWLSLNVSAPKVEPAGVKSE